jgi:hypothetical protein
MRTSRSCYESKLLSEVVQQTQENAGFRHVGAAEHQGRPAELWVAQTPVVLHRAAKKNVKGRRSQKAGRALPLRLIVVQLRHEDGRSLAEWKLLSNAPASWADAARLARCYDWRWRIESFFSKASSSGSKATACHSKSGSSTPARRLRGAC